MPSHAASIALGRIRSRADFLNAQRQGCRYSRPAIGLEVCPTPAKGVQDREARVGFTASRKVGGAVQRNRAKRRLRAAAASALPLYGREGHDYVLVARVATLTRPFALLIDDLTQAVSAAHAALDRRKTGNRPSADGTTAERKGGEIGR